MRCPDAGSELQPGREFFAGPTARGATVTLRRREANGPGRATRGGSTQRRRDREGWLSPSGEQRFRELYDRTYDRVWAFVLRRVPDEDAANDVVAETFLAVWRRIRDVPASPRSADAWVFGTARRMLANSWRGSRRRVR